MTDRLRILVVSVLSAAIVVADIAWRTLWYQPRVDAGTLHGWAYVAAPFVFLPALLLAGGLHRAVRAPARAFALRPGRFVVPAAPHLRSAATTGALVMWGIIPVLTLTARRVEPELDLRWVPAVLAAAALAATVVAVRAWRRTIELTPGGLVVRAVFHGPVAARWDRAFPAAIEGPDRLYGVEPDVIAAAINRYHDHPEHRPGIGTQAELDRLAAAISPAGPAAAAR